MPQELPDVVVHTSTEHSACAGACSVGHSSQFIAPSCTSLQIEVSPVYITVTHTQIQHKRVRVYVRYHCDCILVLPL